MLVRQNYHVYKSQSITAFRYFNRILKNRDVTVEEKNRIYML